MERGNGNGMEFFNGFGGFVNGGKEYEIVMDGGTAPPAPWINVVANPDFGFTVSEAGAGVTWAYNSRENKITPWSNDPVRDPAGEAIYVRDAMTGRVMTPTSLGRRDRGAYRVRHGFGYSLFFHEEAGLRQRARVFTPAHDMVKLWELELENVSGREMQLQVTYYAEWVMGTDRSATGPYVVTAFDNRREFLSARNVYSQHFRPNRAFIFADAPLGGYSGDRQEVLGRGGSTQYPEGLEETLSNNVGVGMDACGAIQVPVRLAAGETRRLLLGMGYAPDEEAAGALCDKYRKPARVARAFAQMQSHWEDVLGAVQVETSDRAMDILLNGWLLYQTVSCRLYARTAFYQNGGAFGFRDQLQDSMALVYARPDMLRAQLLMASSRQFLEGDVQHWWHPPTGVGVRTRITDDLLWLPYVAAAYVRATGDTGVLREQTPFLLGPQLAEGQHDMMFVPEVTKEKDTLYGHCRRAIARAGMGERGMPLIGGGDWNDGMDRVGIGGRGESVWLAWFYYAVLDAFIPLAETMGERAYADELTVEKARLRESIEASAWDGEWYLRAFYDDGSKLGSHENEEARIDSISQSWSVISGAGRPERARRAFASAMEHLVLEEEGVSLLLTPPFDKTPQNPGYIKDYHPGIRENGGQYTHGAIWLAISAVLLGEAGTAHRLFTYLNPIRRTADEEGARKYEKEPYVMAADVYYEAPYTGRGGWSWYTGSAGWMYQGLLAHFLGLRREGDSIYVSGCVPEGFGGYTIRYRYRSATYVLTVQPLSDPAAQPEETRIRLRDDGQEHRITVESACRVKLPEEEPETA
ncbi:MAG TPA: hypothetical protein VLA21_00750 [Candidatus Limnocylindria bacterium]|nr:hypothetical protein [Candidatus Limnocylindria bacterium]